MLLPSGRWNGHHRVGSVGRCYCHVADGIATGSYYFSLSSEVLNRTSSYMWGRWYLPMFLFRDGLLTLMYRASFMALMRFCSSLPTMLKFSLQIKWLVHLPLGNNICHIKSTLVVKIHIWHLGNNISHNIFEALLAITSAIITGNNISLKLVYTIWL